MGESELRLVAKRVVAFALVFGGKVSYIYLFLFFFCHFCGPQRTTPLA